MADQRLKSIGQWFETEPAYPLNVRMTLPNQADKQANTGNSEEDIEPSTREDAELREGRDYYLENGLFVFTAAFLRRRGYCCESGCRHCPYEQQ